MKNKDKLSVQTQAALSELSKKILHVEEFKEYTKSNILCPFEVACLVAKKASVIIADYHHILSPSIREHLMERINKDLSECIIIIDEAHNLPSRCRELLSTQLSTISIDIAIKEAESTGFKDIGSSIKYIKDAFEKLSNLKLNKDTRECLITKTDLLVEISKFIDTDQLINDLFFIGEKIKEIKKRSACTHIANFLINWQGPDEGFSRILKLNRTDRGKELLTLNYNCLDPALITKILAEMSHSIICMSGTLTPLDMYKDLFGFEAVTADFKNPFPHFNKLSIIVPDTTTKFTARSQDMYKKIAVYCSSIVNEIPGNSAIFFPSYELRDRINFYIQNLCIKTTFLEVPNMSKDEKSELIDKFKSYKNSGAVLLGASSGNFGEGIDIEDNILKCVIVVGVPLDRPDLETQELIRYYDNKFGKGWDYGYIMPAIIKCLQNAGRCIRSENDRGVIIFLDQRYIWDSYFKCFPKDSNLRITKEPIKRIKEFFENKENILS
ncbi:ATP-dependent DNA helicase [Candidatus Woesearchaeota archaeon]|nr:ATP-dependent DNA helicase [Candidatus Woesearchaeota archaeon]